MRKLTTVLALSALAIASLLAAGAQAQTDQLVAPAEQTGAPAGSTEEYGAPNPMVLGEALVFASEDIGPMTSIEGLGGPGWTPVVEEEPCGTYYPGATRTSYTCGCAGLKKKKIVEQEYCSFCGCVWLVVSESCTSIACWL